MLIAVRAEVESVDHWREKFKTHVDLFKSQGVSLAHMGAANDKTVIAVFETNDVDEFLRISVSYTHLTLPTKRIV